MSIRPGARDQPATMMLGAELQKLKTDDRSLRKFGLVVGAVLTGLGLYCLWRHKPIYPYFLAPGLLLAVTGLIYARVLKPVYLAWMTLALVLGLIMSTLILVLFFYLVVTPIGLMARALGKDFLGLKWQKQAPSYWIPRENAEAMQPSDYEKQY
jgi:hypothetical protein